MRKRGKEALYTIVKHKALEDVCDFCGQWSRPFDTYQINASMCDGCHSKVLRFHSTYRREGGQKQNPYTKRLRRKYGKDYSAILSGEDVIRKNII